jgi:hypothetical protein
VTRTCWLIPASRLINGLSVDLVKVAAAASYAHILIVRGRIMGRLLSTPVEGSRSSAPVASRRLRPTALDTQRVSGREAAYDST